MKNDDASSHHHTVLVSQYESRRKSKNGEEKSEPDGKSPSLIGRTDGRARLLTVELVHHL
jgi:hypothetical protein